MLLIYHEKITTYHEKITTYHEKITTYHGKITTYHGKTYTIFFLTQIAKASIIRMRYIYTNTQLIPVMAKITEE